MIFILTLIAIVNALVMGLDASGRIALSQGAVKGIMFGLMLVNTVAIIIVVVNLPCNHASVLFSCETDFECYGKGGYEIVSSGHEIEEAQAILKEAQATLTTAHTAQVDARAVQEEAMRIHTQVTMMLGGVR